MATEYTIPITRRHYAGQTALEAGITTEQEWAYDETNERIGIMLSDSTYRYIGQSELFPPGAGVNPTIDCESGGAAAYLTVNISTNDMKINTKGTSDDKMILGSQETDVLTIDGGETDIYTVEWTDYSSTTTLSGFSGTPTKYIYYKVIGRTVFCCFSITGTSDDTDFSFTLPWNPHANLSGSNICLGISSSEDNGGAGAGATIWAAGSGGKFALSNTLDFNVLKTDNWTGSGVKSAAGFFTFELP